jgi:tetratricopeptide (TPR) repeat protein
MSSESDMPPLLELVAELGVIRMRVGVGRAGGEGYRPRMCMWVDHGSGVVLHFELGEPAPSYLPLVMKSLKVLVNRVGGLPRQIQLRDPTLAKELKGVFASTGVEVVVRESLPALDEAIESLMNFKGIGGTPEPGLLDQKGMTLEHVMAFADAAKAFYQARPWRNLIDDDLIAIESPEGPPGTAFCQVLGAGGRTFGFGFVPSRKAHEELHQYGRLPRGGVWSLTFGEIDSIPFEDGEMWERHRLALAGPQAYPTFLRFNKSKDEEFPTPQQLVWAEGLLRAMTATTEDELDRGRWEKQVETFEGMKTYRFSMPILLEQMEGRSSPAAHGEIESGRRKLEALMRTISQKAAEGPMNEQQLQQYAQSLDLNQLPSAPATDAERARALVDQAFDARGRRQVQLAREALKIDPDCVDALLILAERAGDPESSLPLYRRAVEAGERQLGAELFAEAAGHFWGLIETRPYMRARQQLAVRLLKVGQVDQAIDHFGELLRLNPGDNQGNRYLMADALLFADRPDELAELLDRPEYKDEVSAEWSFTRALHAYRRTKDSPQAAQELEKAMGVNPFVVPLLTGHKQPPALPPTQYSPGSEEEAIVYLNLFGHNWFATPGAIEWIDGRLEAARKQARKARTATNKKGKRKSK